MKLEILDTASRVVRTYASTDPVPNPHPATDRAAYNKVCQETPSAPDCGLPLYWPAAAHGHLDTRRHAPPVVGYALRPGRRGRRAWRSAAGAVPHRTYPSVNAPWAPPGSYTVRLTIDGKSYTQPIDAQPRSARQDVTGGSRATDVAHDRDVQRRAPGAHVV